MTDHNLLELAAKAAGYKVHDDPNFNTFWVHPEGAVIDFYGELPIVKWNPLKDDGDALRLAVKLNIAINFGFAATQVNCDVYNWGEGQTLVESSEDGRDNPYAATRRAIVRAAAEIGKAL